MSEEPKKWARPRAQKPVERVAARIGWRVKGSTEGPVYEGQVIVRKCATCGERDKNRQLDIAPAPPTQKT